MDGNFKLIPFKGYTRYIDMLAKVNLKFCFKVWEYVGCTKSLKGGGGTYVVWAKKYTTCELREEEAVQDSNGKWIPKNKKLRDVADVGPKPGSSPTEGAKAAKYRRNGRRYDPGGQTATPPSAINGAPAECKCYDCYEEYDMSSDVNSKASTNFSR